MKSPGIEPPADLLPVLESAARLQQVVPDAVLVGGTASAAYAGHRLSFDHDHVLDLRDRYEAVLEAVEATDGWATSVRASKPPLTIMDRLAGIEAGLRQLRRSRPLETQLVDVAQPQPRDHRTLADVPRYKGLADRWGDWAETRRVCADLAQAILNGAADV